MLTKLIKKHTVIFKENYMRVIILLITAIFTFSANAGQASSYGKITNFHTRADGLMLKIDFSETIVNPGNCEGAGFYIAELDDSPASQRFYSAILTAFTAKKSVQFWISGCTQNQWWGKTRPRIYDIYIQE